MNSKTAPGIIPKVFGVADFIYIGLCLTVSLGALFFFRQDLNQTLNRLTEQPVGTISYKHRAAQRRFADRVLWDRLKQESPVYNGDYIRTAELSAATVSFFAGDEIIALEENTLIQIFAFGQKNLAGALRIDLAEGGLSADVRSGAMSIHAGETVIDASAGSVINAAASDGGLAVQVLEGSAEIQQGNEKLTTAAGDVFASRGSPAGSSRVAVLSPRPGAKLLNNNETPLPVTFNWNRIGFTENETVRLDIAEDRGFTRIIQTIESGTDRAAVNLANGAYYWRVYASSEAEAEIKQSGVNGRVQVVYAPPPALISPARDEAFSFKTARPGIRFQWSSCEGASAYLVEASIDRDMQNVVWRSQVQASGGETGSVVYSGLEPGSYFWRVSPVYPRDYEGTGRASEIAGFRINRAAILAAPESQERRGEENSYFTWKQEDEAVSYTFLLSRQQDLSDPLIKQQVRDNYYPFEGRAADLVPGQYYWGVYQTDMEGNNSAPSPARALALIPPRPDSGAPQERAIPAETAAPVITEAESPSAQVGGLAQVGVTETPAAATPPRQEARPDTSRPLSAPRNLRPAAGYVLTEEIIIRDRKLDFSWAAVAGASGYIFTLYQITPGGNREIQRSRQRETTFTLTDLSLLDAGRFMWRVEALNQSTGQDGAAAESQFTVDIGEVEASQGRESGVLFGNQ